MLCTFSEVIFVFRLYKPHAEYHRSPTLFCMRFYHCMSVYYNSRWLYKLFIFSINNIIIGILLRITLYYCGTNTQSYTKFYKTAVIRPLNKVTDG